jgi:hypothetical protein
MLTGVRSALQRFPVPALAFLLLAIEVNLDLYGKGLIAGRDLELPLAGLACAALALNLNREAQAAGKPGRSHAFATIAGAIAFVILFWDRVFSTHQWALLASLAGLVLVAPFLGRGGSRAFWMFGVRLAFAVLLSVLALLLLAGGLSAILASLTYLFGVDIPERSYEHIWATTGFFIAPLFSLGQIPTEFETEPDISAQAFMERGVRVLGDYVAAPLLLVYAAILHAYALKIVVTGNVPEGQIGWLVLCYGAIVMAALIVIHPFLDNARAATRLVARIWPLLLAIPLALLAYAVTLRINAYGVTPERYLLTLFGLTLAAMIVAQIPKRSRGDIRYLVALPVFGLLAAGFGPQGALATSVRSQLARFDSLVAKRPLVPDSHIEALSILHFLLDHNAIAAAAPPDMEIAGPDGLSTSDALLFREIAAVYGINPDLPVAPSGAFSRSFSGNVARPVDDFDIMVPMVTLVSASPSGTSVELPGSLTLSLALSETAFEVRRDEKKFRFPLPRGMIERMATMPMPEGQGEPPVEPLLLEEEGRRILLFPTLVEGELKPSARLHLLSGVVLLRTQDWR